MCTLLLLLLFILLLPLYLYLCIPDPAVHRRVPLSSVPRWRGRILFMGRVI